jgi:hypothetical protein
MVRVVRGGWGGEGCSGGFRIVKTTCVLHANFTAQHVFLVRFVKIMRLNALRGIVLFDLGVNGLHDVQ